MKIIVKLTVLFTTLLLLTGVSFAIGDDCHIYEYIRTNLDNPDHPITDCIELCFNEKGDNLGTYANFCGGLGNPCFVF